MYFLIQLKFDWMITSLMLYFFFITKLHQVCKCPIKMIKIYHPSKFMISLIWLKKLSILLIWKRIKTSRLYILKIWNWNLLRLLSHFVHLLVRKSLVILKIWLVASGSLLYPLIKLRYNLIRFLFSTHSVLFQL